MADIECVFESMTDKGSIYISNFAAAQNSQLLRSNSFVMQKRVSGRSSRLRGVGCWGIVRRKCRIICICRLRITRNTIFIGSSTRPLTSSSRPGSTQTSWCTAWQGWAGVWPLLSPISSRNSRVRLGRSSWCCNASAARYVWGYADQPQ